VSEHRVIIVHLRRPKNAADESRSDPFWEYGSFGITGCHTTNLMNPRNACKLGGVRLAFAQGGKQGTRLVHLTPPVEIVGHPSHPEAKCLEAKWSPPRWPFRYGSAPILASNHAKSDFPKLAASLKAVRRNTAESKFASKYRTSATYLDDRLGSELIAVYTEKRKGAPASQIARSYVDALPWPPRRPDGDREQKYTTALEKARSKRRDACGGRKEC